MEVTRQTQHCLLDEGEGKQNYLAAQLSLHSHQVLLRKVGGSVFVRVTRGLVLVKSDNVD